MRILTFTSLYPNRIEPRNGIFVKNRMDYFDRIKDTSRMVIAPVQYMPLPGLNKTSRFYRYNQVARKEIQGDITVYHPRYFTIPGTNLINVADAMANAGNKILKKIYAGGETFDLIDGHYLYPDGVAAFKLAKKYNVPLILTARGSDVNFWMERPSSRAAILRACRTAAKVICVSKTLKDRLIRHGVSEDKLTVIMNGVDRSLFTAGDNDKNHGEYLLSVGNLIPLKGHEFILHAMAKFPDEKLVIIGSGELETHLKNIARRLDLADRVTFIAHISQQELAGYYRNAKFTILMSAMEGMPNVMLESLASGAPVIATNVGGIPEVITEDNGILLNSRTTEALTGALTSALGHDWNRQKISRGMSYLDWPETARQLHQIFSQSLSA